MKRQALGKGLESLLPRQSAPPANQVSSGLAQLPLDRIRPNPNQPRERFEEAELADLAASIRSAGLLQPILVRAQGEGYELVAGERRLRAARLAGLATIPALVQDVDPDRSLEFALIENIQRQQLSPIEEARAFQKLMSEYGLTQEALASRVGRARSTIANTLRFLLLPSEVQRMLEDRTLTAGHAKALLALDDHDEILEAARRMAEGATTVRQAEALTQTRRPAPSRDATSSGAPAEEEDPNVRDAEIRLQRALGTKVRIRFTSAGKGRVEIDFYSGEELQRLFEQLEGSSASGPII